MQGRQAVLSILFLCDYQAPYGGNFIASMMRLDEALILRHVPTCYLFPAAARKRDWCMQMEQRGKHVEGLCASGLYKQLRQLLSVIDETHATVLHVHFGYFPLAELAAVLRPKLNVILHFHSDFSGGRRPGPMQRFLACCKRLPERIIGRRLKKVTVSEGSLRTTKDCIPLRNALCETRFASTHIGRENMRAALSVAADQTLVLAFGWSPWIKGVDIAAQAVRMLHAQGATQFVLGVVCGRTYTQERMRAFLEEKTGCTGQEPWMRFLAPIEDVFSYHEAADIMVSASRSETFSYALLEAVCTGKPCASSDIPGVGWAKAFDSVRFFPTEDCDALADTLVQLDMERTTPEMAQRLQNNAAQARESYGIDGWVAGMLDLYGLD